jgi:hypothetical protein
MKTVRCCVALALTISLMPTAGAAPEEIRIYEPGNLTRDRYDIVTRLWVESWRSAFYIRGHSDRAAAIAELKTEAARLGANALTNVACLVDNSPLWGGGPHFCYALAIKVK